MATVKKARNKITRSHSTSIQAVDTFLILAKKDKDISKISLGIIKPIKTASQKRIKCTLENACVRVQVRGNSAIQEIRFFTTKLEEFKSKLEIHAFKQGFEVSK